MKTKQLILAAVALAVLALSPMAAQAEPLTFTITPQTGTAGGSSVTFTATATNRANNLTAIRIIRGSFDLDLPGTVDPLDDTPFGDNFIFQSQNFGPSIAPGSFIMGDVFIVTISAATPPGEYIGAFSVRYNASGNLNDPTEEVPGGVRITVQGVQAVPEPASIVLLGTGLAGVVARLRKRGAKTL